MDRRISTTVKEISSNVQKCWKINELSENVNLSTSQFEELFKRETQMPPLQFIKQLRFEKAKTLLETTFLTVKEVSFSVGIYDQSHFVRDFKQKYGLSPTEYRKKFDT
jgi:transcriptional regulator GlxA family with amidase domain